MQYKTLSARWEHHRFHVVSFISNRLIDNSSPNEIGTDSNLPVLEIYFFTSTGVFPIIFLPLGDAQTR